MKPCVGQLNVIVPDVDAAARFLAALGVDVPDPLPGWPEWGAHHRTLVTSEALDIELDSSPLACHWGGLPTGFAGTVLNLHVDRRPDVDDLFERAVALGGETLREPYDAFWGARYALVRGPGPLVVGITSPIDASHRSAPPAVTSFTDS